MKKQYELPEAEWIRYCEKDIIATSGEDDDPLGPFDPGDIPVDQWGTKL